MANQDVKNIRLNQSFTANPTRRVMRKKPRFIDVSQKTVKPGLCPICGGLGCRLVKAAPHSHNPTIKVMCTQCLARNTLNGSR
jgi:hypothetical protein